MKKVSLIENFTISQSYNFAADSMNWSNVNTSILLRLVKNFNLNLSATWDPYTYQLSSSGTPVRVNVPRWKAGKGWVKLASTGTSFSYTFNNQTFKKKKDKDNGDNNNNNNGEQDGDTPLTAQTGTMLLTTWATTRETDDAAMPSSRQPLPMPTAIRNGNARGVSRSTIPSTTATARLTTTNSTIKGNGPKTSPSPATYALPLTGTSHSRLPTTST